eukprot:9863180-Heterocapsa_arctica.AAC.1
MHVVWLYNRYHIRRNGVTPYEQVNHRSYNRPVLPFGTLVCVRRPDALLKPKLEARWIYGLWLGRQVSGDEHIVITAQGMLTSRTCKPMPLTSNPDLKAFIAKLDWGSIAVRQPNKLPSVADAAG